MLQADRLLKLVELLHSRPGVDAEFLARACGASERTLRRDLDALTAAGFPVYFDHGYRLAAPTLLPPVGLTADEALALNLAAQRASPGAEPAIAQSLATATRKLGQALAAKPTPSAPERQLDLALPVEDPRIEAIIETLTAAMAQHRSVKLTLRPRRNGPAISHQMDPYRLLPRPGGWELLAYCRDRRRIIRVPLALLGETAMLRRRFSPISPRLLARHLHREAGPPAPIRWLRLACRPPLADTLRKTPPVGALMWEEAPSGSIVFTIGSFNPEELLPWLLACGDAAEVLQPESLRQQVRRIAEAVAAAHAPAGTAARAMAGPHRKPPSAEPPPPEPPEE